MEPPVRPQELEEPVDEGRERLLGRVADRHLLDHRGGGRVVEGDRPQMLLGRGRLLVLRREGLRFQIKARGAEEQLLEDGREHRVFALRQLVVYALPVLVLHLPRQQAQLGVLAVLDRLLQVLAQDGELLLVDEDAPALDLLEGAGGRVQDGRVELLERRQIELGALLVLLVQLALHQVGHLVAGVGVAAGVDAHVLDRHLLHLALIELAVERRRRNLRKSVNNFA